MSESLPDVLNLLVISRADEAMLDRIKSIAPDRLNVLHVWDDFQPELAEDYPAAAIARRAGATNPPKLTREELEEVIREAHICLLTVPYPRKVRSRMPNLIWAHVPFAGVTGLSRTDWWQPGSLLTSARGSSSTRPIAESAMAGAFMLARRLDVAVKQTAATALDPKAYEGRMAVLEGKTMAVIGLGGIGSQVATLARGCGMRVIASRHSAKERQLDVDGVDVLYPPAETHAMLAEADYVAVCAMWTPETNRMLDEAAFAAVKPGAVLLNVARGELLDEAAMVAALHSGQLGGAYVDVWDQDTIQPASEALLTAPNVVVTPHVSGGSDTNEYRGGLQIFYDNLERLLKGEPLVNAVDWARGY